MSLERYQGLVSQIGKVGVNALYPNDIELYILALELVDSSGDTKEYFVFPINPKSISEKHTPLTNIKRTAGGITTISTQTFSPNEITLSGNFGRQFKILVGKEVVTFSAFSFNGETSRVSNVQIPEFSPTIKTGYGCIKVLERIIKTSQKLDENGKPYQLFLYNLALGNNYLVKCTDLNLQQDESMNMIWSYSLSLTALIEVEKITNNDQKSLSATTSSNAIIQKGANSVLKTTRSLLGI